MLLDVEMGTFTPFVLGTNGGMGIECQILLIGSHAVISWLRTRLSFEILRSVNMCVRGSRIIRPFKNANDFEDDFNFF